MYLRYKKGQKANGAIPCTPGYRERIEFSEVIGDFALVKEDGLVEFIPTTRGILHYSKEGVHLVPSAPKDFGKL